MSKLVGEQVKAILDETVASFPHGPCSTCECFLGLVAQFRVDSDEAGKALLAAFQVDHQQMHACLGCDPCPPGDRYAAYMRVKRSTPLITI